MPIVYQATNLINGKRYIGVTKFALEKRASEHRRSSARRNSNMVFHAAIRKHGYENFKWEVLADHSEYGVALRTEIYLIGIERPEYNITAGGQGTLGFKPSVKSKEKQQATIKRKGYKSVISERCRQKQVEACRGKPGYWLGKKRSPETIEKARIARLGGKLDISTEERAERRGRAARMRERLKRSVICLTDNVIFDSLASAARNYGVTAAAICSCLKGRSKTSAGRTFKYTGDM